MMHKKGSLNLSIQAIVIIVIAMSVMGLSLTFVDDLFSGASDTFAKLDAETREKIVGQLRDSGKKIAAPKEVTLKKGGEATELFAISNTGEITSEFGMVLTPVKKQDIRGEEVTGEKWKKEVKSLYLTEYNELGPTDGDAVDVKFRAAKSAGGTYIFKATVFEQDPESPGSCPTSEAEAAAKLKEGCTKFTSKSFFIKVQ